MNAIEEMVRTERRDAFIEGAKWADDQYDEGEVITIDEMKEEADKRYLKVENENAC
jgi:hypothetical protein